MASTCSPTSLQLRFAFSSSHSPRSSSLHPPRLWNIERHVNLLRAVSNGCRLQRRRTGSWRLLASDSVADNFSGWSESKNTDHSTDSKRKQWPNGAVGAGVAGVVLFAGITFAALSISKRNNSGTRQVMEPLTSQQEVSLVSDDGDKVEEKIIEESDVKLDNSGRGRESGILLDPNSSPEVQELSAENEHVDFNETLPTDDIKDMTSLNDAGNGAPAQEGSAFDNKSVDSEIHSSSESLADTETVPEVPSETTSELGSNVVNVESDLSNNINIVNDHQEDSQGSNLSNVLDPRYDSSIRTAQEASEPLGISASDISKPDLEILVHPKDLIETATTPSTNENFDHGEEREVSVSSPLEKNNLTENEKPELPIDQNSSLLEEDSLNESRSSETSVSESVRSFGNKEENIVDNETIGNQLYSESPTSGCSFSAVGIPAPSVVSAALQVLPGKVLVPAVVDQVQGQALTALQALKVIEADVQPSDLCTRREYARWLVTSSGALSRHMISKVYPAMYIENVTELAFDDITPEDPDFSSIQGLAEAGIIASKLSVRDLFPSDEGQGAFNFSPESPLSRQDLVSWKMALEKRQLPDADKKMLYRVSGFRDIDRINPDAWPALIADLSAGEQAIISLAFGCTRLFQPCKPVTKAQAAVALATGEASDVVSEELARIEAEYAAENAVSAHNALVAEVERDVNASFETELLMEREKINAVEKMAEEARKELEMLRAEREEDNIALMKERASIESEMEVLSKLRQEVEEQLQGLMSNKAEVTYEKERIAKLQVEAENEKQQISRLQYELEVERKALSMARAWAEEEAKRARDQAKALEEARDRWKMQGIKVVVDTDLQQESTGGDTWLTAGKKLTVEGTVSRGKNLVHKLQQMAACVRAKSRAVIEMIIQKIVYLISVLKEWVSKTGTQIQELKDTTVSKTKDSVQELQQRTREISSNTMEKAKGSIHELQQRTAELRLAVSDGTKKFTQKFRS